MMLNFIYPGYFNSILPVHSTYWLFSEKNSLRALNQKKGRMAAQTGRVAVLGHRADSHSTEMNDGARTQKMMSAEANSVPAQDQK